MNRKFNRFFIPLIFLITAALVFFLLFSPQSFFPTHSPQTRQVRIITPQTLNSNGDTAQNSDAEQQARADATVSKVALGEGQTSLGVLTQDFDGDAQEEQVVAYTATAKTEGPISIAYIDFDEHSGGYKIVWTAPTLVTKAKTLSMYTKDLLGDRSICLIVSGLNSQGEQTMTVFQKIPPPAGEIGTNAPASAPFRKIAELKIDGSIVIQEADRSQAYQVGQAAGSSFSISTYGRDYESTNILDQIEVTYTFDPKTGKYERVGTARIPGTQIEQRKVRELLDGSPDKFELFIEGLWYYVDADGNVKNQQYIYFDPRKREIIFYIDNTQEVFSWEHSSATRYGIYISSQNVSVTTLRRLLDIELDSINSIRVKIFEDINLKIGIEGRWDGTYRKLTLDSKPTATKGKQNAWINQTYGGAIGTLRFFDDGTFTLVTPAETKQGKYAFYSDEGVDLLELRYLGGTKSMRETYQVRTQKNDSSASMILTKVNLTTKGLQNLQEGDMELKPLPDASKVN